MANIAYVNGQYVSISDAEVNIEDRGYQFADGIYEVCLVINGNYWDLDGHLTRMQRSLRELRMDAPMSRVSLERVMAEIVRRNRLKTALVYIQATRGVATRNHVFPKVGTRPALVLTARRFDLDGSDAIAARGVAVVTQPDIRWGRVDIKTVSLLPNVLAKQAAKEAGAAEAWLVRDGKVTEGTSSNAWIVDKEGALITHPKGNEILGGITRETALACAADLQIKVHERPFTIEEAKAAPEAFITSATNLVTPVVVIDSETIGNGKPGPVAMRLRDAYKLRARNA
jgi:D-alanine transaminase